MEKVVDIPDTADIFENDIEMYFNQFCENEEIEDMRDMPQSIFYAALIYVYNNVFKNTDRLRLKNRLDNYYNNNIYLNNTNCNSYNYDYLNSIADYYIYLCFKYNKICTISGFGKLTGISTGVIYNWGAESTRADRLSQASYDLWKKLSDNYEDSGEARLWSGKNPVGQLAVMNRRFGWNLPGVSREASVKTIKTAADLPQLSQNGAQFISSNATELADNSDTIINTSE